MSRILTFLSVGTALAVAIALPASADVSLPKQITWTAYGTTSTGYQQSVAIGNALKNRYGMQLNIKTGKNDVSRMLPLREGKADFCACGIALYFAYEGVKLFSGPKWGPQPVRTVFSSIGGAGIAMAVAKDTGVKKYSDLKGKRVAWVRGSPALNSNAQGYLAYAGLTWDDVEKVEFGGFKASVDGIINGQADAAIMSTVTPHAKRLAASPRGLIWPAMDHNDEAAWKRMWSVAPWHQKHTATSGAGLSKDTPWIGSGYSYPVLIANAGQDTDVVYNLVKAIDLSYEDFKGSAPGVGGWHVDRQNFKWVLPFHDGAVKYWKEKGVWPAGADAHQATMVRRQQVLAKAWKDFTGSNPPSGDAFDPAWLKARASALKSAGLPVIFND